MADIDKTTVQLEICALDRATPKLEATEVTVPGVMGLFVVLPGHAPLLANLEIGPLKATLADGTLVAFAINGGFARVLDNTVLILTQTVERHTDIDIDRAAAAKERAEQRLKKPSENLDVARAEGSLRRALTRLETAGHTER